MPRWMGMEILDKIDQFIEAKHLFIYVYEKNGDIAYQFLDAINDIYV